MKTKLLSKIMFFLSIILVLIIASCTEGLDGIDGIDGKDGVDGVDGQDGQDGQDGKDGENGKIVTPEDLTAYEAADGVNGGTAYNKFYVAETGFPQPADNYITDNKDFFRCKSCHGWDLLGSDGAYVGRGPTETRPNVSSTNLRAFAGSHNIREIFDAVKHSGGRLKSAVSIQSLNGTMPDYGLIVSDELIWDIVKFLKEEAIHTDKLYDLKTTGTYPYGTREFKKIGKDGDANSGNTYYQNNCATCHTSDGTTISGMEGETVGEFLRSEPYEIHHLVKFGIPGTSMMTQPFVGNISDEEMVNLYKALADEIAFPSLALKSADGVNGGKMYDRFWASETNFTAPSDPGVNMDDISGFSDFYRCKSCHGWDQMGSATAYIDRGPKTNRPNVSSKNVFAFVKNNNTQAIFDAIKNTGGRPVDANLTSDGTNGNGDAHPDYGTILTDAQIWDIVKFLKGRAFDVTKLYEIQLTGVYPTGTRTFSNVGKDGDAAAGTAFYDANCAICHGVNGRDDGSGTVISINNDIGKSIGEFAREKPYELQHKSVYGNLGSSMKSNATMESATQNDIKNLLKALSNPANYPDL